MIFKIITIQFSFELWSHQFRINSFRIKNRFLNPRDFAFPIATGMYKRMASVRVPGTVTRVALP
jgi:hypothetical protein